MVYFCLYCGALKSKSGQKNCSVESTYCRRSSSLSRLYPPVVWTASAKGLRNRIAGISISRLKSNVSFWA
jgi:hypothetical protein